VTEAAVMPSPRASTSPSGAAIWVAAARLRTLPAAIAPVVVGTAVVAAVGAVAWGPALAALAGALAIQIGTNFANDAFDAEHGADGPDRLGPLRAVSAGLVSGAAMKRAMVLTFAIATAFGAYLAAVAGWPVIAIGVASVAAGVAYTGGPYPLGYHGLGDLFVMIFFGFVAVCGTAFVQLHAVPALALGAAIPVGAIATAIIVVNNLRDRDGDARVGKRTLAVRLGRRAVLLEYAALLAVAELVPPLLAASRGPWLLLPLATAPLAIARTRALVAARTGPVFNHLLAATGQLLAVHAALLALGLVLSR
jgi:1,4-dihydroxy-2-naphthoate octaprenyltransferase